MKSIDLKNERNLSMLVDFYELTMSNGYYENGYADSVVYCDMFFRKNPDGASFSITAGLQQFIEYIKNLSFSEDDIQYLRGKKIFNEEFLKYLGDFPCIFLLLISSLFPPLFELKNAMLVSG